LIGAFPVKAELHNVVGYVYRFKRAAGGYARFLNSLVFQLVQKWHRNQPIYHGLEVREENVFWPVSALILFCFCFMYLATTRLDPRSMVQHVQHVQHVQQVQHGQHVQHVQHIQHDEHDQQDGQAKDTEEPDDSDKYNNRPGDEIPFKIYISSRLIVISTVSRTVHEYSLNADLTKRMYPTLAWDCVMLGACVTCLCCLNYLIWYCKNLVLPNAAAIYKNGGRLTNIKQYIKGNFKTNLSQYKCLVCVSNIKQYIKANFKTNIKAMSSIKAAAININLVCESNLKHLKKCNFNYKIFKKVAKRFKSLASPESTSTIALSISKLL
jgi:hypothetical protein